ncbi:MAG: hypothetical protein JO100_16015 [Pseudonocardia sp.]|nr:hypothetical protein [Pseudonocardia sp.]
MAPCTSADVLDLCLFVGSALPGRLESVSRPGRIRLSKRLPCRMVPPRTPLWRTPSCSALLSGAERVSVALAAEEPSINRGPLGEGGAPYEPELVDGSG